jgi:septal ring-binding cell division protein DamX
VERQAWLVNKEPVYTGYGNMRPAVIEPVAPSSSSSSAVSSVSSTATTTADGRDQPIVAPTPIDRDTKSIQLQVATTNDGADTNTTASSSSSAPTQTLERVPSINYDNIAYEDSDVCCSSPVMLSFLD